MYRKKMSEQQRASGGVPRSNELQAKPYPSSHRNPHSRMGDCLADRRRPLGILRAVNCIHPAAVYSALERQRHMCEYFIYFVSHEEVLLKVLVALRRFSLSRAGFGEINVCVALHGNECSRIVGLVWRGARTASARARQGRYKRSI